MAKKAKKYKTMYGWAYGEDARHLGDLNPRVEAVLKEIVDFGIVDEDACIIYECTPIKMVTPDGLKVEDLA